MSKDFFEGLTDREVAEVVARSMRHRGLLGVLFLVPKEGGASVFASSTPEDTIGDLTVSEQLAVFANLAARAESETGRIIPPDDNNWVN